MYDRYDQYRLNDQHVTRRNAGRRAGWVLAVVAAVAVVAAALICMQMIRPLSVPSITIQAVTAVHEPGGTGFSWPPGREAAVTVSGLDKAWDSGDQRQVPIASVAKIMTAYIVLRDHPLTGEDEGPSITVTSADVATYDSDVANDDSSAMVAAGESITERQALEALMLPSADNIADLLAQWDAGSITAFAAKMNAQARVFAMDDTDYTDPSGLDPSTTSTAHDQLILAEKAMAVPVLADIVAMPSAVIPVAGTIMNVNYDVGHGGIIGVKTGSDPAAQGCWAFAARRTIAGTRRLVYGVVLGVPASAPDLVRAALSAGVALANNVPETIREMTVLPAGTVVAHVTVAWSKSPIPVVTAHALTGLVVSGMHISLRTRAYTLDSSTLQDGEPVGEIWASSLTGTSGTALVMGGASGKPALTWRLLRL